MRGTKTAAAFIVLAARPAGVPRGPAGAGATRARPGAAVAVGQAGMARLAAAGEGATSAAAF